MVNVRRYVSGDRKYVGPAVLIIVGLALIIAGRVFAEPRTVPPAPRDVLQEPLEYKDPTASGETLLSEAPGASFASQASFAMPAAPSALATTQITVASRRFPVGSTTRVAVTITGLTDGLSGFDVTLKGNNGSGLNASDFQMPPYGLTAVNPSGNEVRVRMADLNGIVEGAPGPFELFSFALTGTLRGVHTVNLVSGAILRLDDDLGDNLVPQATFVAGEYEVTELVQVGLKFVVEISTTRSDAEIRNALTTVQAAMKAKIDELLANDAATQRRPFNYRLKVMRQGPFLVQVYPKLVLGVDTVRSNLIIASRVADLFDFLKAEVRALTAGDPNTWILSWHVHRIGGSFDEMEQ